MEKEKLEKWYSVYANCSQFCVYFKAISEDRVFNMSNKQKQ